MGIDKANTKDAFRGQYGDSANAGDPDWPVIEAVAVTPNDSTDLPFVTKCLHIGGAGDVCVDLAGGGTAIVYKNLAAGTLFPRRVKRVYAANTTATDIVAER